MSEDRSRWLMLFIALLSSSSFLFSMQIVPPVLPTLIEVYGVSNARASNLMSFIALPGVFLSILGGAFVNKYGTKTMGLTGLILVSVGTLIFAISSSFLSLEMSRLIIGVGGTFLIVAMPTLLAQHFAQREMGLAMGIHGLNMPLATLASFNLLGITQIIYGCQAPFFIAFIICMAALPIFSLFVKEEYKERTNFSFSCLRNGQIWLLGLVWATFNMAIISFLTWSPKLFFDFWGLDPAKSAFTSSMFMVGSLITPITGYLSDRLRRRRLLMMLSVLGMTLSFLFLPSISVEALVPATIFFGLVVAFVPPMIFSIPSEIMDAKNIGLGFGILNACLGIGIFLGPFVVGLVMDMIYDKVLVFFIMAIFALPSLLLTLVLKDG
ncbi:MAG: MFS transporter [Nitrososphaerales archaeon]